MTAKKETTALATVTKPKSLATYAPSKLVRSMAHVCTVDDALSEKADTVANLVRTYGSERVEALIKVYLIQLNELLNVKRPLTEIQIEAIATEVVTTHKLLTMADIHVIFRRARTGEYGELYEMINMPKILTWFRKYSEEREEAAMAKNDRETECYKISLGDSERSSGHDFMKVKKIAQSIRIPK